MSASPEYNLAAPRSDGEYAGSLELLAEMGQDFAASLDIGETLRHALARVTAYLGAEAGSLFLLEDDGGEIVCRACDGPVDISGIRLAAGHGIVGRSIEENVCQIIRDVRDDPDFENQVDDRTGFVTRSILCAPMSVKDKRIGAIEVLNKKGGDGLFDDNDRHVLQVLASSAALAILNARMAAELVEKERMRRELELAAEIQRGLLPERLPPPFPVSGINVPARGVSGDFFDFFRLGDGRIAFAIGDVSGKGMKAALLMAKTSSLYRCLGRTAPDPARLLAAVNAEICETAIQGMFVTMVGGLYDPSDGRLFLANAGHEPPLFVGRDGGITDYGADAPPLGILPDTVFSQTELKLEGGALYIFTDGVTESPAGDGRMLGVDGLKGLIGEFQGLGLSERLDAIAERVVGGSKALHDDVTIIAVEETRHERG